MPDPLGGRGLVVIGRGVDFSLGERPIRSPGRVPGFGLVVSGADRPGPRRSGDHRCTGGGHGTGGLLPFPQLSAAADLDEGLVCRAVAGTGATHKVYPAGLVSPLAALGRALLVGPLRGAVADTPDARLVDSCSQFAD